MEENWKYKVAEKNMKNQFWGLTSTFEVIPKTEMIFKNILYYSWVIPSQFPCKIDQKMSYWAETIVGKWPQNLPLKIT